MESKHGQNVYFSINIFIPILNKNTVKTHTAYFRHHIIILTPQIDTGIRFAATNRCNIPLYVSLNIPPDTPINIPLHVLLDVPFNLSTDAPNNIPLDVLAGVSGISICTAFCFYTAMDLIYEQLL